MTFLQSVAKGLVTIACIRCANDLHIMKNDDTKIEDDFESTWLFCITSIENIHQDMFFLKTPQIESNPYNYYLFLFPILFRFKAIVLTHKLINLATSAPTS